MAQFIAASAVKIVLGATFAERPLWSGEWGGHDERKKKLKKSFGCKVSLYD